MAAWVCLVPLLWAVGSQGTARSFLIGFVSGTAGWCGILYWIPYTLTTYGAIPLPLAWLALLLLSAFLGVFVGLFSWMVPRTLRRGPAWALIALPTFWTAGEYLKNFAISGFPWMLMGYSQFEQLSLIQMADLMGTYGVSWLIIAVNVLVYLNLRAVRRRRLLPHTAAVILLMGGAWAYGHGRLRQLQRSEPTTAPIRLGILQGNIGQDVKWSPGFRLQTLAIYGRLAKSAVDQGAEILIWPEASVPYHFNRDEKAQWSLGEMARRYRVPMLFGSLSQERVRGRDRSFNSAYLMDVEGVVLGRYDKTHLVPFGEYVPFGDLLPIEKLSGAMGDMMAAHEIRLLEWNGLRISALICYESIFPEIIRRGFRKGAHLAVVITNDAWFGPTSAPVQHLAMAAFRAVEVRTHIARAANTGISAFIRPTGEIVKTLPFATRGILVDEVVARSGDPTPYERLGDWFAVACLLFSVAYVFMSRHA